MALFERGGCVVTPSRSGRAVPALFGRGGSVVTGPWNDHTVPTVLDLGTCAVPCSSKDLVQMVFSLSCYRDVPEF